MCIHSVWVCAPECRFPMAVSCPALVLGTKLRVEEMAQQLRAFDVLLEAPGSGPSTHMAAHQLSVIPVPGDPVPSSDFHRHQAHMWYIDIHANRIFTHNIK